MLSPELHSLKYLIIQNVKPRVTQPKAFRMLGPELHSQRYRIMQNVKPIVAQPKVSVKHPDDFSTT